MQNLPEEQLFNTRMNKLQQSAEWGFSKDLTLDINSSAKSLEDQTFEMKDHVKDIVKAASFTIYRNGQLSKYLDHNSIERLVHAFVSSRLDSCNILLYGLPVHEIMKIQRA